MKYLIWAVVLYFAWRWYLVSKDKAARDEAEAPRTGTPDASRDSVHDSARDSVHDSAAGPAPRNAAALQEGGVEKMVGCAHCGIHLPLSEALTGADQRHYCSEEHRALHTAS